MEIKEKIAAIIPFMMDRNFTRDEKVDMISRIVDDTLLEQREKPTPGKFSLVNTEWLTNEIEIATGKGSALLTGLLHVQQNLKPAMEKMKPEEAIKHLRKEGIEVTTEEAQKIIDFIYSMAK